MATLEEIQEETEIQAAAVEERADLSEPELVPGKVEGIVDDFLPDKIFNLFSQDIFHVHLPFESEDGYQISADNTLMDGTQFLIQTSSVNGNTASVKKRWIGSNTLSFNERSRLLIGLSILQTSSQTGVFIVGNTTKGYGFSVNNNTIRGITYNSGSTTQTLKTFTAAQALTLEARHDPLGGVVFLIDGEELGTITDTLPTGGFDQLMTTQIQTNTTSVRDYRLSFFDYVQERKLI